MILNEILNNKIGLFRRELSNERYLACLATTLGGSGGGGRPQIVSETKRHSEIDNVELINSFRCAPNPCLNFYINSTFRFKVRLNVKTQRYRIL